MVTGRADFGAAKPRIKRVIAPFDFCVFSHGSPLSLVANRRDVIEADHFLAVRMLCRRLYLELPVWIARLGATA
jgi:hypothetical protein